ncbi:hypothetical protein ABZ400_02835 [Streptomyces sp. NPDC005897]|uniref:hypothetical protein n=1 Tax=Streptomyces sp. NPDC005897 TaxID=3157081 RepID=UPI003404FC7D
MARRRRRSGHRGGLQAGLEDVFANDDSPRLETVGNAVFTIASVLRDDMGCVDVCQDDLENLRARTEKLYARLAEAFDYDSITPPWADAEGTASLSQPVDLLASAWTGMQQIPPMPAEWFREPTEEGLPDRSGGVHVAHGRVWRGSPQ